MHEPHVAVATHEAGHAVPGQPAAGVPSQVIAGVDRESFYRMIIENTTDVVSLHDTDGTCLYVSPSVRNVYGFEPAEVIGRLGMGPVTPDYDPERARQAVADLTDTATGEQVVRRPHVRADGVQGWSEVRRRLVVDPEGRQWLCATARDVSERHAAEEALADREKSLRVVLESLQEGFTRWRAVRDEGGTIVDFVVVYNNRADLALLGDRDEDVTGRSLMHDYPWYSEGLNSMTQVVETQQEVSFETDSRYGPGSAADERYISLRLLPLDDGLVATIHDLTGRRAAERALSESEAHYRLLAEHSADLITRMRPDNTYVYASPASLALMGREPEVITTPGYRPDIHPEDLPTVRAARRSIATGAAESRADFRVRHADGQWVWVESHSRAVRDPEGTLVEIQSSTRDITARRAAEEELTRLALTDSLTGLANRSLLVDRTEQALARLRRHPGHVALLLLDLDKFKAINDSYGHPVGDGVLREVADRLRLCARASDTIGRLGGDEFVVILEELAAPGDADEIADRVLEVMRAPFDIENRQSPGGLPLRITDTGVSIGVAVTSDPAHSPDDLHREADLALYRAKATGRNRRVTFTRDTALAHLEGAMAARRVAAAVADGRLAVRYQRIVDLKTGRVIGAEALVRLDDADGGGLLLPDMFIDVAEDSGLVADIDAWVLDTALAQVASWRQTFGPARHATVSVNVSSRTLAQGGYAALAAGLLGARPLPRGTLHVELTERTLLDSSGLLSEELRLLRHHGALIGLDDFGTGFSGLHYLQRFDLDFVKIDRSYVVGLGSDPRSRTLLGSMIGMAHSLDLPVIAEGVETEAQLTALSELGCDYAQGHLLGQPEPPDTLTAWLGHVAV